MAAAGDRTILEGLGLEDRKPPELFRSAQEVAAAPLNGYSHILRRAWRDFDSLLAVMSVGGRPTVYLQQQLHDGPISPSDQQRFWSNGVAPILVRLTPQEVRVYSGLRTPALANEDVDDNERLVEIFERTAQALEVRQFLRAVEMGTVFDRYTKHFDPTQGVDQQLVRNLRAAREHMSAGPRAPDLPTIHRLLGRVLFTCYLEARGALVERDFARLGAGTRAGFRDILSLREPHAVRVALVRLFQRLSRYFRGDLFGPDLADDLGYLRDRDVQTLRNLVTACNDLASGQLVLPFDVYDFSVIPIETISAVYEDFIRAEDSEAQRKKGAYYTPPKLVEFTTDLATEPGPDLLDKRALDPGCGSGAFLVSLFNRMAEAWVRQHESARNGTRAGALAKILREQICGVDVELIACQATCFSLYLAMLDFLHPREIRRLPTERLPSLLLHGSGSARANGPQTVIHGDFLSSLPALNGRTFDLIVGNPPWVARGRLQKQAISHWQVRHKRAEFPIPARQLACAFLWEIPRYLKPGGRACVLLPAGVLLGDQTDSFQASWFKRYRVDKIAQLADLRFFLFSGADHPTVAMRFASEAPGPDSKLEYLAPKASYTTLFDNVVAVDPDDRKTLRQTRVYSSAAHDQAAAFWLSYNWASPRDQELLSRLHALPDLRQLVGEPEEGKRWTKGVGFQPPSPDESLEDPKPRFWKDEHPFLAADRDFGLILTAADTDDVDPSITELRRLPDRAVFTAPLVVFNKGFSKIAFSPFDVLFQDARRAISGPPKDRDLLMFLTATLVSPLATYVVFHLTSKTIYRGATLLNELIRIPFPLPEDAPGSNPPGVVAKVADIFASVRRDRRFSGPDRKQLIREAKRELTEQVFSYFDINAEEQILIEDVVGTLQRSATPHRTSKVPTLAPPSRGDRQQYAETFIRTLHAWAGTTPALSASCVVSEAVGVAVLTITTTCKERRYAETTGSPDLDSILSRLKSLAPERRGSLVYSRNVVALDNDRLHLVKPLTMRFWLRSAALNDADAVAAHLLRHKPRTVRT